MKRIRQFKTIQKVRDQVTDDMLKTDSLFYTKSLTKLHFKRITA